MKRPLLYAIPLIAACGAVEAQQAGTGVAANPLARFELKDFTETLQRPLFSATRRPPPPPAPIHHEAPPPPPEPPSLTLIGVLIDAQGARALVRPQAATKIQSLRRGDEIDGWKVVEVRQQRIVIARDARTKTIALFEPKPGSAKPAPARFADDE